MKREYIIPNVQAMEVCLKSTLMNSGFGSSDTMDGPEGGPQQHLSPARKLYV